MFNFVYLSTYSIIPCGVSHEDLEACRRAEDSGYMPKHTNRLDRPTAIYKYIISSRYCLFHNANEKNKVTLGISKNRSLLSEVVTSGRICSSTYVRGARKK